MSTVVLCGRCASEGEWPSAVLILPRAFGASGSCAGGRPSGCVGCRLLVLVLVLVLVLGSDGEAL